MAFDMLNHLPAVHDVQELPAPANTNHRRLADKLRIDFFLELVSDGAAIATDIRVPVTVRRDSLTGGEPHEIRGSIALGGLQPRRPVGLEHTPDGYVTADNVHKPMPLRVRGTDESRLSAIPLRPCEDVSSF